MPYYYGGYGDFLANNIYFLLLIPVMILSLWAQVQVSGSFDTYSRVSNRRRLTGAQAAEAVLRANGVYDVTITSTWGKLTDHYDPRITPSISPSPCTPPPLWRRWGWQPTRRATPSSTPWAMLRFVCGAPSCL